MYICRYVCMCTCIQTCALGVHSGVKSKIELFRCCLERPGKASGAARKLLETRAGPRAPHLWSRSRPEGPLDRSPVICVQVFQAWAQPNFMDLVGFGQDFMVCTDLCWMLAASKPGIQKTG